jgi:primosomal protein N'
MTLTELNLKHCYDSDEDDILNDFYIPVLEQSIIYYRLAGFFRSSSLAVAARGVQGLLKNEGKMKLIAGAVLSKEDVDAIKEGTDNPEDVIERTMIKDLNDIRDEFIKDHIKALSWMIANKKLDIKIALVIDQNGNFLEKDNIEQNGIFHQKIGIFEDTENNTLSFSGSANESASAWKNNIEDFNVFRGWMEAEKPYLEADLKRFHKFWNGEATRTKIIDVPTAIREKLISLCPSKISDFDLDKWNQKKEILKKKVELRPYQNKAVSNWLAHNKKGIFEMATGTGKTFTALACVNEVIKNYKKSMIIISCPYQHLIQQWNREIEKFCISADIIIADSSNLSWKHELTDTLIDLSLGYKQRIFMCDRLRTSD